MLTLLVYLSFAVCAAVYCVMAMPFWLLSLMLPSRTRGKIMRYLVLGFGYVTVRCAMRPFFEIRYSDRSGVWSEPMIHVFNHRSGSDPFLVAAMGKEIIQFVNGWPMRLPFFGYFARLCEYVDVTKTSYERMASHVGDLMSRGVSIVAFPEGHRACSRRLGPFHSGVFRIAMEARVPVCPCVIVGNEDIPDRRFRFRRRGTILIRRLRPIDAATAESFPSAFAFKRKVSEIIAAEAASMDKELDESAVRCR